MQSQNNNFSFTGSGGEYFRIWIVNLLLTIITLGIYSAWAKVRRMQYFHRNTWLNGSSFDYHGTPMAILKGRLIAVGMLVAYNVMIEVKPMVGLVILALIMIVMPVLLVKSFRFRLFNTSYRGLRFGFGGSIKAAYMNFLALPLLSLVTLYLLAPFTHQRIKAYQVNSSRFGQTSFAFGAGAGSFYKVYFFAFLMIAVLVGALGYAGYTLYSGKIAAMPKSEANFMLIGFAIYGLLIAASLLIVPYFITRIQNLVWNNTSLGEHRFSSSMSARSMMWLMFSNFIAIILTLGLFKPFADIRMARYRMENLALQAEGDLEAFIADTQQQETATGHEAAEMFDVDIAF